MILKDDVTMRNFGKRIGVFALLFSVLFLPVMHVHPASEHGVHGETYQALVHADFFPNAVHGHQGSEKNVGNLDEPIVLSHDRLPEIDLLVPHIAQSFQLFSVFKKRVIAVVQNSPELYMLLNIQRGVLKYQYVPPPQIPQISPPSLRAPPSLT
ncbi:hypothetical protein MNBD_NITROSPIRAE01-325 [hydrothermal vent metagenome]|uniref:Uncharacterized protein n=1 Tax=hydrothermal vent metagenome TaxID=652676 RepID=A0A3B1DUW7_9ZZZZ